MPGELRGPDALNDLDARLDRALAGYSQVAPPAGAVERWLAHVAEAPASAGRFLWLPAPAWAALAFALLLLLSLTWLHFHRSDVAQPSLAQEKMIIQPVSPAVQLTPEQQKLIEILASDPSKLATMTPEDLDKLLQTAEPPKPAAPAIKH
ncbi:MAG TPA: hypothetical protein VFP94_07040 [Terriglobales bacterium]|nr:hypothetical protein [Terriglobales bacterium]